MPSTVLYDGECGLCARVVQFVLPRDRHDRFRFAALQSAWGQAALTRHGRATESFDSFVLVLDPETPSERVLDKSQAAIALLRELGGLYALTAAFGRLLPRALADRVYDVIARNRKRVFGNEQCLVPTGPARAKFLR